MFQKLDLVKKRISNSAKHYHRLVTLVVGGIYIFTSINNSKWLFFHLAIINKSSSFGSTYI